MTTLRHSVQLRKGVLLYMEGYEHHMQDCGWKSRHGVFLHVCWLLLSSNSLVKQKMIRDGQVTSFSLSYVNYVLLWEYRSEENHSLTPLHTSINHHDHANHLKLCDYHHQTNNTERKPQRFVPLTYFPSFQEDCCHSLHGLLVTLHRITGLHARQMSLPYFSTSPPST